MTYLDSYRKLPTKEAILEAATEDLNHFWTGPERAEAIRLAAEKAVIEKENQE